jgi:hypothetical protein
MPLFNIKITKNRITAKIFTPVYFPPFERHR